MEPRLHESAFRVWGLMDPLGLEGACMDVTVCVCTWQRERKANKWSVGNVVRPGASFSHLVSVRFKMFCVELSKETSGTVSLPFHCESFDCH